MADSPSSPANIEQNSKQPESDNPFIQPDQSSTAVPPQEQQSATPNPNSNQVSLPSPIQSHVPPQPVSVPPTAPSYRPVTMPAVPQFSPVQNFQNTAVQPPGVGVSGSVAVTMAPPMMPYHVVPGQLPNPALRPYAPVPNGYGVVHAPALGGSLSLFVLVN